MADTAAACGEVVVHLPSPLPAHPRLLARDADWPVLRSRIETDAPSALIFRALHKRAEALLAMPPLGRDMTGRMLLMVARQALERISVLSIVDRVSGDHRYAARAIDEMLAICRFSDWNPDHYLDTAELCLAMAIGYDWLHDEIKMDQRREIEDALIEKGLKPSLDVSRRSNWWLTTDENWAQVCHGGLAAAAIVLAGRDANLSQYILDRAVAAIPTVAANYAPDGAYPEGPMYWSYGTAYHVVLAASLERLTGSTHGLDRFPGFAESADYINAVTAPSGDYFNYADCAARRRLQAQLFWLAERHGRPDWVAHDLATLEDDLAEYLDDPSAQYWYYDMLSLALLWHRPVVATTASPPALWTGRGTMPVTVHRWGERQCFLGVKGGTVGLSHSHMDVGSFVFEADGERWAVDTGMQDYAGLEAAGVDLWNEREQDSQRWSVFRIGIESHNVLRFDDMPQLLSRHAPLASTTNQSTVNLSDVYGQPIKTAVRRFSLQSNGFVVQDSWTASVPVAARVQWLTYGDVELFERHAILKQSGRRLRLEVESDLSAVLTIDHFDHPVRWFDAPNLKLKRISVTAEGSMDGSIVMRAICE